MVHRVPIVRSGFIIGATDGITQQVANGWNFPGERTTEGSAKSVFFRAMAVLFCQKKIVLCLTLKRTKPNRHV